MFIESRIQQDPTGAASTSVVRCMGPRSSWRDPRPAPWGNRRGNRRGEPQGLETHGFLCLNSGMRSPNTMDLQLEPAIIQQRNESRIICPIGISHITPISNSSETSNDQLMTGQAK